MLFIIITQISCATVSYGVMCFILTVMFTHPNSVVYPDFELRWGGGGAGVGFVLLALSSSCDLFFFT